MRACLLLLTLFLSACHSPPATPPAPTSVLLISLDGVRPDYLGRGDTPHLDRLAQEGVSGQLIPSYPSLTFPNHYSMVTGLYPDHHGIVHNSMRDAELGRFRLSDREAVSDGRWWQDGEPIWVTAERAGLPTATLSWPGSEAEIHGIRPTRWHVFDSERPIPKRVEMVLAWLSEPEATRPQLATLYFEHPDSAGHHHGPDSQEVRAAMREVDTAIGVLLDGLKAHDLEDRINLVIVSDHGMAEVPASQVIATEEMVPTDKADIISVGQVISVAPHPGQEDAVATQMVGAHVQYDCWRKGDLPPRWHYGTHPRVPAIICQMHEGWDALPHRIAQEHAGNAHTRGSHGYDPALESMHAMFIAYGPAFKHQVILPAFENVNIQPLLLHLLDLPPMPGDGELTPLLPALNAAQ